VKCCVEVEVSDGTIWMGEPAICISVFSWATTENDIDHSIGAFVQGRALAKMKKW
jgi:hypothetical protein